MSDGSPPSVRPAWLHVRVEGVVQGVGFRWFVRERATRLGVAGWVRNLPDGSVEVSAAGIDDALRTLRAALEEGPPRSRVSRLVALPEGEPPSQTDFQILRGHP